MRVCEAHVGCSPWGKGRARSSNIGCRDTNRGAAPTPHPTTKHSLEGLRGRAG